MSRLRRIKDDDKKILLSPYYFQKPLDNKNPNHIEIGMGKGNFIITNATRNPNVNFYGLDKYPTVILKCVNKLNSLAPLNNLKLISTDVTEIKNFFPLHFFSKIYLNFSDPWPKKRHEKRRLTSNKFLDLYKQMLTDNGIIEFKTDNDGLYEFTLETLKARKDINILDNIPDLYKKFPISEIVQTEYETKFINMGIKIKYISFKFI